VVFELDDPHPASASAPTRQASDGLRSRVCNGIPSGRCVLWTILADRGAARRSSAGHPLALLESTAASFNPVPRGQEGLNQMSYVLLEDGTHLDGVGVGAGGHVTGEVVFNTSMTGYQESVTDPSYAGQLIVFTYPHIGNYGVSDRAMESERIHARGVVMRDARNHTDAHGAQAGWLDWLAQHGVPAITGLDTRALVRHIRDLGAMRGGIFDDAIPTDDALRLIGAEASMTGRDLARQVSPTELTVLEPTGQTSLDPTGPASLDPTGPASLDPTGPASLDQAGQTPGRTPTIAVIDTGVKRSILDNLRSRGARLLMFPCATDAQTILDHKPDAVFLANGPGDPAALDYITGQVRLLLGRKPIFGICLGHQVLCRAVGLETYKLPFGHRGANHPVKDLQTGRIEITSQNHGFAVLGPDGARTIPGDDPVTWQTDFGRAELTHLNLYDRTVEGLALPEVHGATVQYHPEAGPGPHDALHLFDRFIAAI
jgi:carbamoyl-phosphate synthase small subunit